MGPTGTVITFPESMGLPSIFNSKPVRLYTMLLIISLHSIISTAASAGWSLFAGLLLLTWLISFHQLSTSEGEVRRPKLHKPIQVPGLQDKGSTLQPGMLQGCPGTSCPGEWSCTRKCCCPGKCRWPGKWCGPGKSLTSDQGSDAAQGDIAAQESAGKQAWRT